MTRRMTIGVVGAAIALILALAGQAAPDSGPADARHSAVDLGTLGGPTSRAYGINQHTQIVGTARTADGADHAFLWEDGQHIAARASAASVCSLNIKL